jgi:hypothetical protein
MVKIIIRWTISVTVLGLLAACTTPAQSTAVPTERLNAPPTTAATATSAPRPAETRAAETRTAESSPTHVPNSTPTANLATTVPDIQGVFGVPITFATRAELDGFNFQWGPSDGDLGAIPTGNGNYAFYGSGGSKPSCPDAPKTHAAEGVFTFSGTLDHVTSGNGCARVFGFGNAPSGWVFDRDYAGGGQVVRFAANGKSGWLMSFHSEYQWKNMADPPSYWCQVGNHMIY